MPLVCRVTKETQVQPFIVPNVKNKLLTEIGQTGIHSAFMPNTQSAVSRTKKTIIQTRINKIRKSKYKNAIKQMDLLIKSKDKEKAKKQFAKFDAMKEEISGLYSKGFAQGALPDQFRNELRSILQRSKRATQGFQGFDIIADAREKVKFFKRPKNISGDKSEVYFAVVHALNKKIISAAGIDVTTMEPPKKTHPYYRIINSPNFIWTPHTAWASDETLKNALDQLIENINAYYLGKPKNLV